MFADRGGFVITDYDVDLALHTDGTMDVQEQITVDFHELRHGIYREIPLVAPM